MFYPVSINLCLNNCLNMAHFFHHTVYYSLGNIFANSQEFLLTIHFQITQDFSRFWKLASLVAQMVKHLPAMCGRPRFDSWVGKTPWRRKWQSTPALLLGKSHGWRSLIGYSPWGHKESDTTEWLHSLLSKDKVNLFNKCFWKWI